LSGTTRLGLRINLTLDLETHILTFMYPRSNFTTENLRILNVVLGFLSRSALTICRSLRFSVTASSLTTDSSSCVNTETTQSRMLPTATPSISSNLLHASSSPSTFAVSPTFLKTSKLGPCSIPGLWTQRDDLLQRRQLPLHLLHLVQSILRW
jgi:hypothetical protein